MIDPMTMAALVQAGSQLKESGAGSGLISPWIGNFAQMRAITKDVPLDEYMAQQIAELNRREQMNAMGVDPLADSSLRNELQQSAAASRRASEAQASIDLAGAGAGSGEALKRALAQQAQQQAQQQRIGETVAKEQIKRKSDEEDELERLIAQQSQREVDKRAARAAFISGSGDILQEFAGFQDTIEGGTEHSTEDINAVAEKFGVTPEKAAEYLEFMSTQ